MEERLVELKLYQGEETNQANDEAEKLHGRFRSDCGKVTLMMVGE